MELLPDAATHACAPFGPLSPALPPTTYLLGPPPTLGGTGHLTVMIPGVGLLPLRSKQQVVIFGDVQVQQASSGFCVSVSSPHVLQLPIEPPNTRNSSLLLFTLLRRLEMLSIALPTRWMGPCLVSMRLGCVECRAP